MDMYRTISKFHPGLEINVFIQFSHAIYAHIYARTQVKINSGYKFSGLANPHIKGNKEVLIKIFSRKLMTLKTAISLRSAYLKIYLLSLF